MESEPEEQQQSENPETDQNSAKSENGFENDEKEELNQDSEEKNSERSGDEENFIDETLWKKEAEKTEPKLSERNFKFENGFERPAGLASERCTRDFMSAKIRKFYSKYSPQNSKIDPSDQPLEMAFPPVNIDRKNLNSFTLLSQRFTAHSNVDKGTSLQSTNSSQDDLNSRKSELDGANLPFVTRTSSTTSSTPTHLNRTINSINFVDTGDTTQPSLHNTQLGESTELGNLVENSIKDVDGAVRNKRDKIFVTNSFLRHENRLKNTRHSDIFGANEQKRRQNDAFEYEKRHKRTSKSSNLDSFEPVLANKNVTMKLTGLKSETCEKDLETLCRCCKLQILSISLDRNIITHSCLGTGKLKLRNPQEDNLHNFQNLLKLQGYNYQFIFT